MDQVTTTQTLPLFYKNPQAINVEEHGKLGITPKNGFLFAKNTNSIPVTIPEYSAVLKHYPIVFLKEPNYASLLITGFRQDENLFVNDAGEWSQNTYIPGYVNRYPFIFFEDDQTDQLILCIDVDADSVQENGKTALFDKGEPTEFSKQALEACSNFQQGLNATQHFVKALDEAGILVENQAELSYESTDQKFRLSGFCVVDQDKFKALPKETILDWHEKGWLYLVYAHFMSMGNWSSLAALTQKQNEKPATLNA